MANLKVYRFHPEYALWDNKRIADFDFLRLLKKEQAVRSGDRKVSREYTYEDEVYAKAFYEYVEDENGVPNQIVKRVELIDEDENTGMEYSFIRVDGYASVDYELEKGRAFIFSDLKSRGKKLGAAAIIDLLYSYFGEQKRDFVETGSTMFKDAVLETLSKDRETVDDVDKPLFDAVVTNLNRSLDGKVKVYETLVYLTTL